MAKKAKPSPKRKASRKTKTKTKAKQKAASPADAATSPVSAIGPEFAVVAFGASAGAVDVLKHTVGLLDPNWYAAYIVALHVSPKHASQLVAVLSPQAKVKVVVAKDGAKLVPGTVFVIPPKVNMRVQGEKIILDPVGDIPSPKPSVNVLFSSLAEELADRTVAVILSGTGSDGAKGLEQVKKAGGITIAQDPEYSAYDGMPQAAIDTKCVDLIAGPEAIADVVGTVVSPLHSVAPEVLEQNPEELVVERMAAVTGVDFSYVKSPTLQRRIRRRMAIRNIDGVEQYLELLTSDDEARELATSIPISVTSFFRDPAAFKEMRRNLEQEFSRHEPGLPFRVWVVACCTGEEAYSIAMLLRDISEGMGRSPEFTVFASDLDVGSIEKARVGDYPIESAANVPPALFERYLITKGDRIRVKDSLRRHVVFSTQNVLTDAPFSRIKLISCRNFLIYVRPEFQKRVLDILHYSLLPSGLLFLGRSEQAPSRSDAFNTVSKEHRIYRKQAPSGLAAFPEGRVRAVATLNPPSVADRRGNTPARTMFDLVSSEMARTMIPNWVVIDRHDIIKYVSEGARSLVRIPSGPAVLRVQESLVPEIVVDLPGLLFRARREEKIVSGFRTPFKQGGRQMTIKPLIFPMPGDRDDLWVVVLDVEPARVDEAASGTQKPGKWDENYVLEMERRHAMLQEDLRSMSEVLETSNEELQSQSEELQSANEELQSTNEQLLTSNEELQSSNEELLTVNDEMRSKTEMYSVEASRLTALSAALEFPVLSFDANFRLTAANPASAALFETTPVAGTTANGLPWRQDARRLLEAMKSSFKSGKPAKLVHGKPVAWRGTIQPVIQDEEVTLGTVVTFRPT